METWSNLKFWKTEAWLQAKETVAASGESLRPAPSLIFRPLVCTPLDKVKVAFIANGPGASSAVPNGLALSYEGSSDRRPYGFHMMIEEWHRHFGYKIPETGDLERWAREGVLLWNAIPTCLLGFSGAHKGLWEGLTKEIMETVYLQNPDTVFCFMGTHNLMPILPKEAIKLAFDMPAAGKTTSLSNMFGRIQLELRRTKQKVDWRL